MAFTDCKAWTVYESARIKTILCVITTTKLTDSHKTITIHSHHSWHCQASQHPHLAGCLKFWCAIIIISGIVTSGIGRLFRATTITFIRVTWSGLKISQTKCSWSERLGASLLLQSTENRTKLNGLVPWQAVISLWQFWTIWPSTQMKLLVAKQKAGMGIEIYGSIESIKGRSEEWTSWMRASSLEWMLQGVLTTRLDWSI